MDEYIQRLWAVLGAGDPVAEIRHRALFIPAFHAETLITVPVRSDGSADLFVRSFERSLWYALQEQHSWQPATLKERLQIKRGLKKPQLPPLPAVWHQHGKLDLGDVERLGSHIRPVHAAPPPDNRVMTADGIGLRGEFLQPGTRFQFEAHSPRPGDPRHSYFATVLALARSLFDREPAQSRLAELQDYL